LGTPPWSVS